MRKFFYAYGQKLQILSILMFFVLTAGIVTGSVFYMKTGDNRAVINECFSDIFHAAANNENKIGAAKSCFFAGALSCAVIFISAYFRAGILPSAFIVLRRGFITGFTSAAAAGAYGLKGALITAAVGAELALGALTLVLFAAVSISYSTAKEKISKKFLIFFLIFSISIFCVISLSRGFVSTTFMKFLYPKIA